MMAKLWADKIICGEKTYSDVPRLLKNKVAEILREAGREDLILEEQNGDH